MANRKSGFLFSVALLGVTIILISRAHGDASAQGAMFVRPEPSTSSRVVHIAIGGKRFAILEITKSFLLSRLGCCDSNSTNPNGRQHFRWIALGDPYHARHVSFCSLLIKAQAPKR
jgi:hypothetical protein